MATPHLQSVASQLVEAPLLDGGDGRPEGEGKEDLGTAGNYQLVPSSEIVLPLLRGEGRGGEGRGGEGRGGEGRGGEGRGGEGRGGEGRGGEGRGGEARRGEGRGGEGRGRKGREGKGRGGYVCIH